MSVWQQQIEANAAAIQQILDNAVEYPDLPLLGESLAADDLIAVYNTSGTQLTRVTYQTLISGLLSDAPSDGNEYVRKDGAWVLNSGGGTTLSGLTDTTIGTPTLGSLLVYNGASWVDLAVGTNGQVLTANSGATEGVDWQASTINLNVRNTSGLTITKGTAVYDAGWNSGTGEILIDVADADDANKMPAIGIVSSDIANNSSGQVIVLGVLENFDTSFGAQGDNIYVSTTGTLTNTRPIGAGSYIQKLGSILNSNATTGEILISGANRSNDLPQMTENYVWIGNANGTPIEILYQLSALKDTNITAAAKGDILAYDGTNWVDLTAGSNGQILSANSGAATGLEWIAAGGASSPLTTKGDIWVYSTVDTRLPVGTNGHALFANSTPAEGMEWRAIVEADISDLGSYLLTASNGLTAASQNVKLGGTLTEDTTITANTNFELYLNGNTSLALFDVDNSGGGKAIQVTAVNNALAVQNTSNTPATNISSNYGTDGNTIITALQIDRLYSAGVGANGIGTRIEFRAEQDAGNVQEMNRIESSWSTAATATRTSRLDFTGIGTATRNILLRLEGGGQVEFPQYGSGTFTGTSTYMLAVDSAGNIIEDALPGTSPSYGTDDQIPFTNVGGTDFDYSANFRWEGSFLALENGGNFHTRVYNSGAIEFIRHTVGGATNVNHLLVNPIVGNQIALATTWDGAGAVDSWFFTRAASGKDFIINIGGKLASDNYGSGTQTGTATYMLAVDSAGNIIEEALPGGGTIGGSIADNQVAFGAVTANEIEGEASFTYTGAGFLYLGVDDTTRGTLSLYGDSTVNSGQIVIYNAASYDTTINAYTFTGLQDFVILADGAQAFVIDDATLGLTAPGMSNADIDTLGAQALITKGYADANYSGGGGTIGGSITDNQIAFGATTADDIEGSANFTWNGSDMIIYDPVNDGNPTINIGSSVSEKLQIQVLYDAAAQTLNRVKFDTYTVSATANKGEFGFYVDNVQVFEIKDAGIIVHDNALNTIMTTISGGQVQLNQYGANTFTGTAARYLAVDSSGNIIEEPIPAGGLTSPLTTKGDIWVYSTVDDRLPVGTNGHALFANSVQTTGHEWRAITEADISDLQSYLLNINSETLSDLSDIPAEPTGGSIQYYLRYDDTGDTFSWVDITTLGGASALNDLTDVTITTVTNDEVLQYTGAGWENQTLAEAGISAVGHTHTLAQGATDVTATASELNLLDLSGLTVGWVLRATGAATATWAQLAGSDINNDQGWNNYSHPNHTGDVTSTGDGATVIDPTAISGKTLVTAVATDMVLLWDATDSTLKRADVSDFLSGGGIGGSITDNQVAFGAVTANNIEGSSNFTYDGTNVTVTGGDVRAADFQLLGTNQGITFFDGGTITAGTTAIQINAPTGDEVQLQVNATNIASFLSSRASIDVGLLTVGATDSNNGVMYLYGDGAASTAGGEIQIYTAADHDTTINFYGIKAFEDDLVIELSAGTDILKYDGALNKWIVGSGTGFEADGFQTPTGASTQFLKADGSVDSSTYLTGITGETISNLSDIPAEPTGGALKYFLQYNDTGDAHTWENITTLKPTLTKSITIPDPVAADDATIFYTPVAITITEINSHITAGTNVVFNISHAATRTGTPLDVFTSDITLTSTAGQTNNSGFNDATIPAGSWVWLDIISVSGAVTWFHTTLTFTED